MILHSTNLSKSFGKHRVLDGVNLSVADQDRVALVGFNGAGKTTLIRCILGEYLFQGDLLVAGKNPRFHRAEVLKKVGFVPQLPPPLKMTVRDLFDFAATVSEGKSDEMAIVAKHLGLDLDRALSQPFNRLSGGQKQKVLIAIALGRRTSLLILDEPAANLDPEARHLFFDLLAKKKDEAAMLISSHRIDEVASLVTRVIELDKGKVVLDDQVVGGDQLGHFFSVHVRFHRAEPAVHKTFESWALVPNDDRLEWRGSIAGPDRLRFMGVVSRYSGLISKVDIQHSSETQSNSGRKRD